MEPFLETEYSAQMRNRVVPPNWWNVLVPPTPNLSLTENKKITTPNLFLPPRFHSSIHQSRWRTNESVGRRRIAGARRSGRRRKKLRADESTAAGRRSERRRAGGASRRAVGGRQAKRATARWQSKQARWRSKRAGDGPPRIDRRRTGIGRRRGQSVDGDGNWSTAMGIVR
jgi:hypothetical protein